MAMKENRTPIKGQTFQVKTSLPIGGFCARWIFLRFSPFLPHNFRGPRLSLYNPVTLSLKRRSCFSTTPRLFLYHSKASPPQLHVALVRCSAGSYSFRIASGGELLGGGQMGRQVLRSRRPGCERPRERESRVFRSRSSGGTSSPRG